ncbi:DUF4249 domain-containing protein [Marivirga sp. S37H4]|uniref:DUF4249 domain-containing protein n=1 Tax=Marivirga aurantiaca TaxID=2802615 RepID=A0A934WWJ8_9BACT|nr:DUF4249 domain-containing protein [Marivirga aurantiaca]MBK6264246.1 DUF4249 domain-containing protein [Marivirga aurantiaca]
MKNKIVFILGIMTFTLLWACEKDIEIEIKETEEKMVLNSWLEAGEAPAVSLSNSIFIFSNKQSAEIENAIVKMFENGKEIGTLTYQTDAELYTNESIIIKDFHEYEIVAEHPEHGEVSAVDRVPEKYGNTDIKMNYKNNVEENGVWPMYSGEITFEIKDKPNQKNYYLFKHITITEEYNADVSEDTVVRKSNANYGLEINGSQGKEVYMSGNSFIILNDDIFDGKSTQFRINSYNDLRMSESSGPDYYYKEYHQIEMHQISESLYRYFISLDANQYPDVFTEPSQVYSNIVNGYGILGLSTKQVFTIDEKRE